MTTCQFEVVFAPHYLWLTSNYDDIMLQEEVRLTTAANYLTFHAVP